jgi:hypothetical protein
MPRRGALWNMMFGEAERQRQQQLEDMKAEAAAKRFGVARDLFRPQATPEPVDSRGLMRMGDLSASGQEPVDVTATGGTPSVTQQMFYHPDRPERGGAVFWPSDPAARGYGVPTSELPSAGPGPQGIQGENWGQARLSVPGEPPTLTARPGPAPDVSGIPPFEGQGTRTVARAPRFSEVMFRPDLNPQQLRAAMEYGPGIEKLQQGGSAQDALAAWGREVEGGADPDESFQRYIAPLLQSEEGRKASEGVMRHFQARSAAKRAEAVESEAERKRGESERKAQLLEQHRDEARRLAVEYEAAGRTDLANQLRLAATMEKPETIKAMIAEARERGQAARVETQQAGATQRVGMQQTGASARQDVAVTAQGERQDKDLAAREARQKADLQAKATRHDAMIAAQNQRAQNTIQSRTKLQAQSLTNQKAMVEYRRTAKPGAAPDTKTAGLLLTSLNNERNALNRQIKMESDLMVGATFADPDADTSESRETISFLKQRRDEVSRELEGLRKGLSGKRGPQNATKPPANASTEQATAEARRLMKTGLTKTGAIQAMQEAGWDVE